MAAHLRQSRYVRLRSSNPMGYVEDLLRGTLSSSFVSLPSGERRKIHQRIPIRLRSRHGLPPLPIPLLYHPSLPSFPRDVVNESNRSSTTMYGLNLPSPRLHTKRVSPISRKISIPDLVPTYLCALASWAPVRFAYRAVVESLQAKTCRTTRICSHSSFTVFFFRASSTLPRIVKMGHCTPHASRHTRPHLPKRSALRVALLTSCCKRAVSFRVIHDGAWVTRRSVARLLNRDIITLQGDGQAVRRVPDHLFGSLACGVDGCREDSVANRRESIVR